MIFDELELLKQRNDNAILLSTKRTKKKDYRIGVMLTPYDIYPASSNLKDNWNPLFNQPISFNELPNDAKVNFLIFIMNNVDIQDQTNVFIKFKIDPDIYNISYNGIMVDIKNYIMFAKQDIEDIDYSDNIIITLKRGKQITLPNIKRLLDPLRRIYFENEKF